MTMTIKQPGSTAAAPPPPASARAGTPRRRLIILAGLVLVILVGVLLAVTALSQPTAPAEHGTARPFTGMGTGTTTLNLATGAVTAEFTVHGSPLGAGTGSEDLTVTPTGPGTFTYTGTRTFLAANGDKVFSAITGRGTFTRTTAHSTETDTITGGTGRFAGASGTYRDTVSFVVVSVTGPIQTSRFTAAAQGQIRY